jgi:hypothetical protein
MGWSPIPLKARALFDVAVDAIVGNGVEILFWKNRWLNWHTLAETAPNLFKAVPRHTVQRRTVAQALQNRRWVSRELLLSMCCMITYSYGIWWMALLYAKAFQIIRIGS